MSNRISVLFCHLPISLVLILFGTPAQAVAQESESAELLQRLRNADAKFLRSFTLEAETTWAVNAEVREPLHVTNAVKIVRQGDTWAFGSDVTRTERFKVEAGHGETQASGDGDIAYPALKQWILWKPTDVHTRTAYASTRDQIHQDDANDPLQHWQLYISVLGTGRGYARYLESIQSIDESPTGTITCVAAGVFPNPGTVACRWELEVEPDAGFLVRKARVTSETGERVLGEFSNEGHLETILGTIAARAEFTYGGSDARNFYHGDGISKVRYEALDDVADETWIAEVARQFDERNVGDAQVWNLNDATDD
jgi:hypothetical protein